MATLEEMRGQRQRLRAEEAQHAKRQKLLDCYLLENLLDVWGFCKEDGWLLAWDSDAEERILVAHPELPIPIRVGIAGLDGGCLAVYLDGKVEQHCEPRGPQIVCDQDHLLSLLEFTNEILREP